MLISVGAKTSVSLPLLLLALFFFAVVGLASRIRSWVAVLRGKSATALTLSWCCAVLSDRVRLKHGPWWLHHCGGRASLQMHFAECEISGMTACEPGFSNTSFPCSSHDNLSTIWKACWALVCLFFLVGQCGMKERMEGREPGVWVLAYMQPAEQSPSACGRTHSPSVHLAPAWGTSWVLHLSRKLGLCSQCRLQLHAWIISVHHHSSCHLCLGSLSWAVSSKG